MRVRVVILNVSKPRRGEGKSMGRATIGRLSGLGFNWAMVSHILRTLLLIDVEMFHKRDDSHEFYIANIF